MNNYINALLSDISYLYFKLENKNWIVDSRSQTPYLDRNIANQEQLFFINNFKVINQENSTITGFSATTFEVTSNDVPGYTKGQVIVAYRGTEAGITTGIQDLLKTDLIEVALGLSSFQNAVSYIIDKITTLDIGFTQTSEATSYLERTLKSLPNNQNISITGHSLGGFLATYVSLYNNSRVDSVTTFNGAGFSIIDRIIAKFQDTLGIASVTAFKDKITHIYSDTSSELVSKDGALTYIGNRIPIYTEDLGLISNHFLVAPRQAMMLYDSFYAVLKHDGYPDVSYAYAYIKKIFFEYKYPELETLQTNKYQKNFEKSFTYLSNLLGFSDLSLFDKDGKSVTDISSYDKGLNILLYLERNGGNFKITEGSDIMDIKTSDSQFNIRSKLYSIINYIPFMFSSYDPYFRSSSTEINLETYNYNSYNQAFLDKRLYYYHVLMTDTNKNFTQNYIDLSNSSSSGSLEYTFFYSASGESVAYIDTFKKIVLLQNMTEADFYNKSSKKIFFVDQPLKGSLAVTGDNSIVFDSFKNDYISVHGKNVDVYLTQGSDTVTIEVAEGGSLGIVDSKDGGAGDVFIFHGSKDADTITGTKYNDIINGNAGDDNITANEGDDRIYGGVGNDTIMGGDGDDVIYGNTSTEQTGDLSDANYINYLYGGLGRDIIVGGEGKDIINNVGTNSNSYISNYGDIITGGKGDDEIYGTKYGDTFNYTLGDGNDIYTERYTYSGMSYVGTSFEYHEDNYIDMIRFKNISSSEVSYYIDNKNSNLYMNMPDGSVITFTGFLDNMQIEKFVFEKNNSSEVVWYQSIIAKVLDRTVDVNNNVLLGNDNIAISYTETLRGRNGINNIIQGGYGKDIIYGGDKDDFLGNVYKNSTSYLSKRSTDYDGYYGDSFTGGKGNDQIWGTAYGDNYYYNKGDGDDTITEYSRFNEDQSQYIDQIILGAGITQNNLTISRDMNNNVVLNFKFSDNTTGSIIMKDFILGYGVEKVVFSDNTTLSSAQILDKALTYYGTENGELIEGTARNDIIYGNGGADTINGYAGDDKIYVTGTDKHIINAGDGKDFIYGGDGVDVILGGYDADTIFGGAGNDIINSSDKNSESYKGHATLKPNYEAYGDNITGGLGDDIIYGTAFADIYNYTAGDGNDTIYDQSGFNYQIYDNLILNKINPEDVSVKREGDSYNAILSFSMGGSITLVNFYAGDYTENITFSNTGKIWGYGDLINKTVWNGTSANDTLKGSDYNDTIYGGAGNDIITGGYGTNYLYGGDGDDTIYIKDKYKIYYGSYPTEITYVYGGAGNDIIGDSTDLGFVVNSYSDVTGGTGDDKIYGSSAYNVYRFNVGDGNDIIYDTVNYIQEFDKIVFGPGISLADLKFNRENKTDLVIQYSNNDKVNIKNYFFNPALGDAEHKMYHGVTVRLVEFSNGSVINLNNYQNLTNQYHGTDGDDYITMLDAYEIIKTGKGNDKIFYSTYRYNGGEYYGEEGEDILSISGIGAIISGGKDNDDITILGENNIVKFDQGDGVDILKNFSTNATLQFNSSISDFYISNYSTTNIQFTYGNNSVINMSSNRDIKLSFNEGIYNLFSLGNFVKLGNSNDVLTNHPFNKLTAYMGGGADIAYGSYNNDFIAGENGNDTLYGLDGDDVLDGGNDDDYLNGGLGFNTLIGGNGNDTIYSTTKQYDYLLGGSGNDTYVWNSAGAEITDSEGANKIWLKGGQWTRQDYKFSKVDTNLVITRTKSLMNTGASEILTVNDFFNNQSISAIQISNESDMVMNSSTYTLDNAAINRLIEAMAAFDASSDTDTQAQLSDEMNKLWHYS